MGCGAAEETGLGFFFFDLLLSILVCYQPRVLISPPPRHKARASLVVTGPEGQKGKVEGFFVAMDGFIVDSVQLIEKYCKI